MARKRIGEVLLERGLITAQQLDAALSRHRFHGERLGASLVALGAVSERQLATALGELQGLPVLDLSREIPEWHALHAVRPELCEKHLFLPVALREERGRKQLVVAMADPLNIPAIDEIELVTGARVRVVLATATDLRAAITRYYRRAAPAADLGEGKMELIRPGGFAETVDTNTGEEIELEEILALEEEVPVAEATRRRLEEGLRSDLSFLLGAGAAEPDRALEKRFDALVALLVRKGLLAPGELEAALLRGPVSRA